MVLDTAWTPLPGDRADVVPLRPFLSAVVRGHDLSNESLALLDRWAESTDSADVITVEGVTYWYRLREDLWHWLHERLMWRFALAAIDPDAQHSVLTVPDGETALIDVARAMGRSVEVEVQPPAPQPPVPWPRQWLRRYLPRAVRQLLRRSRGKASSRPPADAIPADTRARRERFLPDRLERLRRAGGPPVLVLTLPGSYQRIGDGAAVQRRDPNLGSVVPALAEAGLNPIVIGWNTNSAREDDWAAIQLDERLLPTDFVYSRWGRPDDGRRALAAIDAVAAHLAAAAATPLLLDGVDLTTPFTAALRAVIDRVFKADVQELARVERLIAELRPRAILTTQEGHRLPWLMAGARAGVPTYALQHGVLYAAHPGYPHRRHPMHVLPSCTFVFGDYERRVLEGGAYRPGEVVVSGSPRLDLDASPTDPAALAAERASVRTELGVADDDVMLVVSTGHLPFVRRSYFVQMLEATLGGPLGGVHIVFKQHPGEQDEGPARRLLEGLARARGYEVPRMTFIKDIDLYRLLRAADAHLGQHSTVLTDAVIARTPNLIAMVAASNDILGYVPAGVARPVHDVAEVLEALRDPRPIDVAARRAFLDSHFLGGNASGRIVARIDAEVSARAGPGARDGASTAASRFQEPTEGKVPR